MVHLDTSFLIRALLRGSPEDRALRSWVHAGESLAISAVAWAEFLCGPVSSDAVDAAAELLGDPAPFDTPAASLAARLFNDSGRRRGTFVDCMIAANAMGAGAALATSNVADFQRLLPLGLEVAVLEPRS